MFSSRVSSRSISSRTRKNEIVQNKVINSSQYLQICKSKEEKPDNVLYDSLFHYEKQIKILKGCLVLTESKAKLFRKITSFTEIKQFAKNTPVPLQPLTEQQKLSIKPIYLKEKRKECQELAHILQVKQQQEKKAQQQFLQAITQQYEVDRMKEVLGVINLQRILNRKVSKKQQQSFILVHKKAFPQKPNLNKIKNVLTSSLMMLSIKLKQTKEYAFRTFLKHFGLESISDQINANLKMKGKALMALKEYPKLNLKRAFWRWNLSITDKGERLFQQASDKLVLYTNINKTTFFYRLYNQVRVKQIKVDPKVKRMTVMLYLYTKMFFERPMKNSFEKIKLFTMQRRQDAKIGDNIVVSAESKEKQLLKKWMKRANQIKEKEKERKATLQGFARRIVQVSKEKKKFLLQDWKRLAEQEVRFNQIKQLLMKKLMMTKIGKVTGAFRIWKLLPQKRNIQSFIKASRFEKGLLGFAQITLKRALDSFKNELQEGQVRKKRAVIQLIDTTQGGQKRVYNMWKSLVLERQLYHLCQVLSQVFQNSQQALSKNFSFLFCIKQYNLHTASTLHKYFSNLCSNTNRSIRIMLTKLKLNSRSRRANKWFSLCAQILATRSHIDVQKSFWRLKLNALRDGKLNDKVSLQMNNSVSLKGNRDVPLLQVNEYKYNILPQKQKKQTNIQLQKQQPDNSHILNQAAGARTIIQKLKIIKLKHIAYSFKTICQHSLKSLTNTSHTQNLLEKAQLLNQQTKLIQQINEYKKENQTLLQQLQQRQQKLLQSNKAVTMLSLRINFMITHKFVTLLQQVADANSWRCLNEGFDAIIEKANENFQREETQNY